MRKRWLRVLEYEGDEKFLEVSIGMREVKGLKILSGGTIREAMLGEFPQEIKPNNWICLTCGIVKQLALADELCPQCREPMSVCNITYPEEGGTEPWPA